MTRKSIAVGIVDGHQLFLDGLTAWFATRSPDVEVAAAVRSLPDLFACARFPVDVALLSLDGVDDVPPAVRVATLRMREVATVVMSADPDVALVRECLTAGALGFLATSEDAEVLLTAVRTAQRGETYLSASVAAVLLAGERTSTAPNLSHQEQRVLVLYASGLPMKSVARRLGVGYESARSYLSRVREKYAECGRTASSKIDLRRRAVEDGLISGR
ncbi:MAG TPA: response regulator transcription factor [Kineosporiaceae bacterium]